jgi:hypothetical protein
MATAVGRRASVQALENAGPAGESAATHGLPEPLHEPPGLPGANGSAATFWRGINFPTLGEHDVGVVPFDRAGHYGAPVHWRVRVGDRPRLLYLDNTAARIATPAGIAAIRAHVVRHGFNHLALYELHRILPDAAATTNLRTLVREMRSAGVRGIFAAVGSPDDVALVDDYLGATTNALQRFDGMVSESEFWGLGTTFRDYLRLVAHMRTLADREGLTVATYLGWPQAEHIAAITSLVDVVFLHAYVGTPASAYPYLYARLTALAGRWHEPLTIWPIFSAEPTFLGPWLSAHNAPGVLESVERNLLDRFRDDPGEFRNGLRLGGFAWFAASNPEAALD